MSGQKPPKAKIPPAPFLIDPDTDEGNQLPTVSKLLNRKKLLKKLEAEKAAKVEKTRTKTLEKDLKAALHKQKSRPAAPVPASPVKVHSIMKNRRKVAREPLVAWTLEELQTCGDPMGSGLALLFELGISESAVFLCLKNATDGQIFAATAGLYLENYQNAWDTGLSWEPKFFPEIWKVLFTKGYSEFPPGSRNINRTAFAIDAKKWLTLIRVGTPDACRGILAVVSSASLALALEKALPLIFTDPDSLDQAA